MISLLYFHFFSRKVFPLAPVPGALLTTFIWCCPIRINIHSNKLLTFLICSVYLLTPAQQPAGSLGSESPLRGTLPCLITPCLGSLPFSLTLCLGRCCSQQRTTTAILAQAPPPGVARLSKMPFWAMMQPIFSNDTNIFRNLWGLVNRQMGK